jgi:glucose dehydrogenase
MKGRVHKILLLAALLAPGLPLGRRTQAQEAKAPGATTEWSSYGGDKASSKYSPLDQIGADNFHRLKVLDLAVRR